MRSPEDCLWEESILLVKAESVSEAKCIAERTAKEAETEYVNVLGELVAWKFHCVQSVYEIPVTVEEDMRRWPGVIEVFSRHMRASEANSLLTPLE
ncbi:MAG: DUF4288 domain-containing protein [Planctomycetes bacterium]|nr:DUF4288 domain-containing protein [Planctomycetota bacterium]